jgi:hypothetical protein
MSSNLRDHVPGFADAVSGGGNMRLTSLFLGVLLCVAALAVHSGARADSGVPVTGTDPGAALGYALSLPEQAGKVPFDPARVDALVDFSIADPDREKSSLPEVEGLTGTSHAFTTRVSLKKVIRYLYNPGIPSYLLMPSSLRASSWTGFVSGQEVLAELEQRFNALDEPAVVVGTEREVITPDANTGGYYAYDTDRVLALFRRGENRVLPSISSQRTPSEVGRKGGVVGSDSDWNYLFSEECGLTRTGLGWVDSYMYGARSVTVYVQPDDPSQPLRVAMYKWLRAGWAGMNMVKEKHILGGVRRYVSTLKEILESPHLPPHRELEQLVRQVRRLPESDLRERVAPYFSALCSLDDPMVRKRVFADDLRSGAYLNRLDRGELERIVLLEYLKCRLGKGSLLGSRFCVDGVGVATARLESAQE